MLGGGVAGVHWCGSSLYDRIAGRSTGNGHKDETVAHVSVEAQVEPTIRLEYQDDNGERRVAVVDSHKYKAEVVRHALQLEESRGKLQDRALVQLELELDTAFSEMNLRVHDFADWYFSYTTGYVLIAKAASSAAQHLLSLTRARPVEELVAEDLKLDLQQKWESIVLRPESTDAQLQRGWALTVREAHREYLDMLERQQHELRRFVTRHTTHGRLIGSGDITLGLDWKAQSTRSSALSANFQRSPVQSVALVGGGGLAGKAAAAAGGKAGAGLLTKFASPFAAKGVAAAGSAGAGAGVGAVAGPLGAVVGAGMGLTIDFGINKSIEVMQRREFESDCRTAIQGTREDWQQTAAAELTRAINVWVDDAIQLLPQKDPRAGGMFSWASRA
eukprot:TRINITY_DN2209_c0_g2_i1.p1 TRINITY_DN2209_c0_g2~~TRINITY_DN2209_c0_g2_i1.p1  ORF type:complete len:454 (+),score=112.12 TRINITY_DN2209_c0_g2_i1:198-1364(+)